MISLVIFFLFLTAINPTVFAQKLKKGATIQVELSPAGSFEIKAPVKGKIIETAKGFTAKKIISKVKRFDTGIDLRTEHTKKKMKFKKFPEVIIANAKATKNGKGSAKITIRGITKKVPVKLKKLSSKYIKASFKIKLSQFKFKGINYMGVGVDDTVKVSAIVPLRKK